MNHQKQSNNQLLEGIATTAGILGLGLLLWKAFESPQENKNNFTNVLPKNINLPQHPIEVPSDSSPKKLQDLSVKISENKTDSIPKFDYQKKK